MDTATDSNLYDGWILRLILICTKKQKKNKKKNMIDFVHFI